MHDLVNLVNRGIPTILVCTAPFEALARGQGAVLGGMEVALALIGHPLAAASPAEVVAKAKDAAQQILQLWKQ